MKKKNVRLKFKTNSIKQVTELPHPKFVKAFDFDIIL